MRKDELKDIKRLKFYYTIEFSIEIYSIYVLRNYVSKQKYAPLTSFTVGTNYSVYIAFWMLGGQQFNHQYPLQYLDTISSAFNYHLIRKSHVFQH